MKTIELAFSRAGIQDASQLVELINSAYRGKSSRQGWTTEADLLDGLRTDIEEIQSLLVNPDTLIIKCEAAGILVGSVRLQYSGEQVEIGMFAVSPPLQGQGIGKRLLSFAEQMALQTWPVNRLEMSVISCRKELIAFYERLGYRRTGICQPFYLNPELWQPKVSGLMLEFLEKQF